MKALLPNNHPTYLRRLARELSRRPAGFYHEGERWNRASYSKANGGLRIYRTVGYTPTGGRNEVAKSFAEVSQMDGPFFGDGNGNNIYASRS